jgi:RNA polymerase primary sigma factor
MPRKKKETPVVETPKKVRSKTTTKKETPKKVETKTSTKVETPKKIRSKTTKKEPVAKVKTTKKVDTKPTAKKRTSKKPVKGKIDVEKAPIRKKKSKPKRRWGRITDITTKSLDFLNNREIRILPKSTNSVIYAIIRWPGYEGIVFPFSNNEIVEIDEPTYTLADISSQFGEVVLEDDDNN